MRGARTIAKQRVSGLSQKQWGLVSRFFAEPREHVMPHDLANQARISYAHALALLNVIAVEGAASLSLLIYHDCSEAPVRAYPYGNGFPRRPWRCANCEEQISPASTLGYDVAARDCNALEFE